MKPMDFRGRWVVITGASSGLGLAMARLLARDHGANLVLVARRADRLESLERELVSQYGVEVTVIPTDLSDLAQVDRVYAQAIEGRDIYGVALNAGVTHFGPYKELDWDGFEAMLHTNVTSTVRLTMKFLPYLEERNEGGGLLLVSSMAGLTPTAYQTAYSATKAFLIHFGCGLYHEVEGKNVSVTTFAPGGIRTEMTAGERFNALRSWLMPVDACAKEAIESFRDRRYLHAPGFVNKMGTVVARLLPRRFLNGRVAATYRDALLRVEG